MISERGLKANNMDGMLPNNEVFPFYHVLFISFHVLICKWSHNEAVYKDLVCIRREMGKSPNMHTVVFHSRATE